MFFLIGLFLGCPAHAHEAHVHHATCGHADVHQHPAVRWVAGYYTVHGVWIPGRWVTYTIKPFPHQSVHFHHKHHHGRIHHHRH